MADVKIKADKREVSTKGYVNQIRRDGFVPGVLYSREMEPIIFTVPELSLNKVVYTTEMHLVDLKIGDDESIKCILKDVQFDPVTDRIIHVDFQAITVGQVIQVQVPLNITGSAIGVKHGGKLNQNLHKLDVECLPKNIPSHLDIDITKLDIGDSVLIKDLEFENITLLNPEDTSVVAVMAPKAEEEEEEVTDELLEDAENAEPELVGKSKSEEESEG